MISGQVVKIHSGRYTILCDGMTFDCSARGNLKIKSDGIVTGDLVEIDEIALTIDKVLPRKTFFVRPSVANVDAVNVVIACPPKPDYNMLDKLLLTLFSEKVEVIISVNKSDLPHDVYGEVLKNYSETGCNIVQVSAVTGEGLSRLKELMRGKLVAFAGQSAVGKSSLVNALFDTELKTNEVSGKTQRGRHTTTVAEIYERDGVRIVDTPGFSVIRPDILPEDVALFYPEYFSRLEKCKFRRCTHTTEPDCAVKNDVLSGVLSPERYMRYKNIFNELKRDKLKY
ncbi:MAG: ribosome small subunit-dependent GTPase A [Clostridia bacterium]|nr:ribosome small subunit-dependent GTPase A [Clostridia bacterium]